jgi:predicted TIM-barrel fold metal-dependent hydrolase
MDKVACDFPRLKLVLAHLGHPWEAETIAIIRRNENVYADISALYYRPWQFYNAMRLAVEYGCCHKLLFGSDYPATTTENSIQGLRNINNVIKNSGLPVIPEEITEAIIYRNSLEILL